MQKSKSGIVFKTLAMMGFLALILIPLASTSDAELWDLVILAEVENATVLRGESPVIAGMIVDHASKPVESVQVYIRSGQESMFTTTDQHGQFRMILEDFDEIPGTYIVNIVGNSSDGKTGMTTSEFQVRGELSPMTALKEKLSTPEAKKYLKSHKDEFTKNPIGFTLYNYYQELHQKYLEQEKISNKLAKEQLFLDNQKSIANDLRTKAIKELKPTHGIFSGYRYDDYVSKLDLDVRDTIVSQLNFTKNLFAEGQLAKEMILSNGGTVEEARKAYLEKIAVTKEVLESWEIENIKTHQASNKTSNESSIKETTEETENKE